MKRPLAIAAAVLATLGVGAAAVQATTGPTDNLPKPATQVPTRTATPYIGHWVIDQAAKAARIDAGQMAIDFTVPPGRYMIGNLNLRYYADDGRLSSFIANVYPFDTDGSDGGVKANILSQGSLKKLGSVTFDKPAGDTMDGTITLDGTTSRLIWTAKSEADVASKTPPPQAKPLTAQPTSDDSGAASGDDVTAPATPDNAGASAAMYAPAVQLAYQLAGA